MLNLKAYLNFLLCVLFSLTLACPKVEPSIQDEKTVIRDIRGFFADVLDPTAETLQRKGNSFKAACISHPSALWFMINRPLVLEKAKLPKDILKAMKFDTSDLQGRSEKQVIDILENYISDDVYYDAQASIDKAIEKFNLETIDAIKTLEHIDVPRIGDNWTSFFRSILTHYFPSLEPIDKKRVLASLLRNSMPDSSKSELLLSLIYGSGPFFQKYIQLLGDYLEPEGDPELIALKDDFSKVKSGLPSIPHYYVDRYISEIAALGFHVEIDKSLGAASIGETFHARLIGAEGVHNIALKLMRPGIEEIAQREAQFFLKQARNISPMMEKSIDDVKSGIFDEMDYTLERAKLEKGIKAYETNGSPLRVAAPVQGFPVSKYWMAMEWAPGRTFSSVRLTAPSLPSSNLNDALVARVEMLAKAVLLDLLTEKLMTSALFLQPEGFFHGDLHEGNLILHIDDEVYRLILKEKRADIDAQLITKEDIQKLTLRRSANGNNLIMLTMVDFGNAHVVSAEERHALINLLISACQISRSPAAFLRAFNELSSVKIPEYEFSYYEKELTTARFYTEYNDYRSPYSRIGDAMDVLMNNDVPIPGIVMEFKRTLALVDNAYKQLRADVAHDEMQDLLHHSMEDPIRKAVLCPMLKKTLLYDTADILTLLGMVDTCEIPDIALSKENIWAIALSLQSITGNYILEKMWSIVGR